MIQDLLILYKYASHFLREFYGVQSDSTIFVL